MSKIIAITFIIVALAFLASVNAEKLLFNHNHNIHQRANGSNCGIVAAPCDNTWQSRFNQTFAFEAAGPFVQLKAYWETYDACLSGANSTPLGFYYTTCQQNSSLWSY